MKLKRLLAVSASLVIAGTMLFSLAACKKTPPPNPDDLGEVDEATGLVFTPNYVGHPTYEDGATNFEGFGVVEDDDDTYSAFPRVYAAPLADEDDDDGFYADDDDDDGFYATDDEEDRSDWEIESYYVSSVGTNMDRELTIPETYNGYPVVAIGIDAFANHTRLRTLHIPSSIQRIARSAFSHCEALKTVDIEEGLVYFGTFVFAYCYELENVSLPDSLRIIEDGVFMHCTMLQEITIPENVTQLAADTFANCSDLTTVNIPFTVKNLTVECFYGCTSLREITIHSDIMAIPDRFFMACTKLYDIYFEGTMAEWDAMPKGEFWDYNTRRNKRAYTVHCADGDMKA